MIVLITPTGARKAQFEMCSIWMQRQTYAGKVLWIIIDDSIPRTTDSVPLNFREGWEIRKIHPVPNWQHGQNTQSRNIEAGLSSIGSMNQIEAIFIIEDDDFYRANYLERMMFRFTGFDVLGEMNTVYYNVLYRTYFVNRNTSHISLFQLAIKPRMIPLFSSCLRQKFIDFKFYEQLHAQEYVRRGEVGFFNENNLAIGMKGMPGRAGIGAGHGRLLNMIKDIGMTFLINQIGEDAKYYEGYYSDYSNTQYDILSKKRR